MSNTTRSGSGAERPGFPVGILAATCLFLAAIGLSGCVQDGAQEGPEVVGLEAQVETPERLRLLHRRGLKARDRGIYDTALSYFIEASDGGYGPASVAAGKVFAAGYPGLEKNYELAAARYRSGVEQGAGYVAELPLGACYLQGLGVPQDRAQAERWFRRGALTVADLRSVVREGSEADAEGGWNQLLTTLFSPHPVPPEFEEAVAWARSLEDMDGEGLYGLSEQYRTGTEVAADERLSDELLQRAFDRDHPDAAYAMAQSKLSGPEEARDESGGIDLLWRAAQSDHVVAQMELGRLYAETERDPIDRQRAYYWLMRAHRNGADISGQLEDVAASLSEEERAMVLENLDQGLAYLP